MSVASDKQAQVQAQYDAVTEQINALNAAASAQIGAVNTQLANELLPLSARHDTLDAQLQVLNEVVAQEQANAPATEAPVEQAVDPNTGQPV